MASEAGSKSIGVVVTVVVDGLPLVGMVMVQQCPVDPELCTRCKTAKVGTHSLTDSSEDRAK